MIRKYLLKQKQELMEQKLYYYKQLKNKDLEIKECMEFIHLIEKSQDKSYESFSPQSYDSVLNIEKIKELNEKSKFLENEKNKIQNELDSIDQKIDELDSVVEFLNTSEVEYRNMEKKLENSKELQSDLFEILKDERKDLIENLKGGFLKNLDYGIRKIELCVKLADMDPKRCKLELQEVEKSLKNNYYEVESIIQSIGVFKIGNE